MWPGGAPELGPCVGWVAGCPGQGRNPSGEGGMGRPAPGEGVVGPCGLLVSSLPHTELS